MDKNVKDLYLFYYSNAGDVFWLTSQLYKNVKEMGIIIKDIDSFLEQKWLVENLMKTNLTKRERYIEKEKNKARSWCNSWAKIMKNGKRVEIDTDRFSEIALEELKMMLTDFGVDTSNPKKWVVNG